MAVSEIPKNSKYSFKRIRKAVSRRLEEFVKGHRWHFENYVHVASRRRQMSVLFAGVDVGSFAGKTVLEVGCGHGHLGEELVKLGARVTSVDGRRENIRQLQKKFPGRPAFVCDAGSPEFEQFGPVDIVFAFGLLYHLAKPAEFLAACSRIAGTLLVESAVIDVLESELVPVKEGRFYDQSLHRRGCRPSPSWVERELRANGYSYVVDLCADEERWNEIDAPGYTRRITGSGTGRRFGDSSFRRVWVAAKVERPLVAGKIVL